MCYYYILSQTYNEFCLVRFLLWKMVSSSMHFNRNFSLTSVCIMFLFDKVKHNFIPVEIFLDSSGQMVLWCVRGINMIVFVRYCSVFNVLSRLLIFTCIVGSEMNCLLDLITYSLYKNTFLSCTTSFFCFCFT